MNVMIIRSKVSFHDVINPFVTQLQVDIYDGGSSSGEYYLWDVYIYDSGSIWNEGDRGYNNWLSYGNCHQDNAHMNCDPVQV
jgi:hypothetical protein